MHDDASWLGPDRKISRWALWAQPLSNSGELLRTATRLPVLALAHLLL
jgi:hypothetical protein